MTDTPEKFFSEALPRLAQFDTWLATVGVTPKVGLEHVQQHGVSPAWWPKTDHIGYKCEAPGEFERLRAMLEPEGDYLFQSYISGRRIAVIRLKKPLGTRAGLLRVLELSDQKPDGSQQRGFDHIEMYAPGHTANQLASVLSGFGAKFAVQARAHHTTYDAVIAGGFKVRLEDEPLLEKIRRDEMR